MRILKPLPKYVNDLKKLTILRLKKIWNPGIEVILVYKRFWRIISNNIGFISMIDCERLSNNEKKMVSLLGVPKKYKGFLLMI